MEFVKNLFQNHPDLIYMIIFIGMFLAATFPISFFVYGEYFFLPAGILAGTGLLNIYIVYICSVLGVFCGDITSYYIGKKFGNSIFKKDAKYLNFKTLKKGEDFFKKHGNKAIFLSKTMPVIPWLSSFLAGSSKMNIKKFIFSDIIAVSVAFLVVYTLIFSGTSILTIISTNFLKFIHLL